MFIQQGSKFPGKKFKNAQSIWPSSLLHVHVEAKKAQKECPWEKQQKNGRSKPYTNFKTSRPNSYSSKINSKYTELKYKSKPKKSVNDHIKGQNKNEQNQKIGMNKNNQHTTYKPAGITMESWKTTINKVR